MDVWRKSGSGKGGRAMQKKELLNTVPKGRRIPRRKERTLLLSDLPREMGEGRKKQELKRTFEREGKL